MANLNDGSPCWLATVSSTDAAGNTIAIFRNSLPNFTRTIIRNGNIIHSWDFGHPQETFIPDVYTTYFDCLYDKCWKEYMSDVYSTNSRRVSCRMRIQGRPNPSWMRKFFYFDNSFWRLNEIKDWNLSTMETTQVEFLKVQNPNNYKLTSIQNVGLIQITLSADSIGYSGGTITGNVISQNASEHWTFSDYINVTSGGTTTTVTTSSMVSPTSGTGRDTPITITVPANSTGLSRTFELKVVSSDNIPSYAYITQAGNLTPYLAFVGTPYTIDAQAGTGTIAFTHANVDTNTIQVTANDSWCTIDSVDTANGIITISVTRNETGSNRSTTLHLSGSGTTATSDTATLTQTSGDLVISLNSMYFDYNQDSTSSKTFTITTDSSWNITTQDQA